MLRSFVGISVSRSNIDGITVDAPSFKFWPDRELGGGTFGTVYEGQFDGRPCAAKVLNAVAMRLMSGLPSCGGKAEQRGKRSFLKERDSLKRIDHPNIVKLYDMRVYPEDFPILIMERLNCSLTCYFTENKHEMTMFVKLSLSCDIAVALEYLCQNSILHRDLCSDNILLDTRQQIPIAKVTDFGMSKILKNFESMSATLTSVAGRTAYYPPELLDDPKAVDLSIDIFMFGVVMTQIAHQVAVIDSPKHRRDLINDLSESHIMKKPIEQCVELEKNKRPSAKDLHSELKRKYKTLIKK